VKLRDFFRTHQEILLRCLYQAVDSRDTAAAANLFSRKIDTSIDTILNCPIPHSYIKKPINNKVSQLNQKKMET
jgi:hypothetical protein